MSELSARELSAGISRRALTSFQRNTNGRKSVESKTLEEHLAGKAIGTPEKTAVIDQWNRNLDLINISGWHFSIRETDHSNTGIHVVEMFFTRPELEMLSSRILQVLAAMPANAGAK